MYYNFPVEDPTDVIVAAARRVDWGNAPLKKVGIRFSQIDEATEAL